MLINRRVTRRRKTSFESVTGNALLFGTLGAAPSECSLTVDRKCPRSHRDLHCAIKVVIQLHILIAINYRRYRQAGDITTHRGLSGCSFRANGVHAHQPGFLRKGHNLPRFVIELLKTFERSYEISFGTPVAFWQTVAHAGIVLQSSAKLNTLRKLRIFWVPVNGHSLPPPW